uniref:Uncharacterized protein n=1 Tax=Arundo donax TaxID=35708 RepID=A0A0A9CHE6_ARUDO
MMTQYCPNILS